MAVGLQPFLILGALLFCVGLYGALSRRNGVAVLMSIELMLNAVNITFVAFARFGPVANAAGGQPAYLAGQIFAIFVVTVAAAEAALGLAIILMLYRLRRSINIEDMNLLRG